MKLTVSISEANRMFNYGKSFIDPKSARKYLNKCECTLKGLTITMLLCQEYLAGRFGFLLNSIEDAVDGKFMVALPTRKFTKLDGDEVVIEIANDHTLYHTKSGVLKSSFEEGDVPNFEKFFDFDKENAPSQYINVNTLLKALRGFESENVMFTFKDKLLHLTDFNHHEAVVTTVRKGA